MRASRFVRVVSFVGVLVFVAGCAGSSGGGASASRSSAGAGTTASPSSSPRFPVPDRRSLPPRQSAALQDVLDGVVSLEARAPGSGVPGLTAAVLTDHGAWTGAAGKDGVGALLSPNAMMLIASVTKTFLAAEVLHLVDAGQVDLDAPLSRYVNHPLAGNGATVRQALSMHGGFRDIPHVDQLRALGRILATSHHHTTVQQSLAFWTAPSTRPGGDPVYSSTGFVLLGMLVEHVTHHVVAHALRADLFTPAGLQRIVAQDPERPTAPVAAPRPEVGVPSRDAYLPCRSVASLGNDSASGVAADASTLARWGYQLYGGRVLPPRLTAMMLTSASSASIFPGTGYGLGTMLFEGLSPDVAVGHLGDLGLYSAALVVVPARHQSIAVLADGLMPDSRLIVRQLLIALA